MFWLLQHALSLSLRNLFFFFNCFCFFATFFKGGQYDWFEWCLSRFVDWKLFTPWRSDVRHRLIWTILFSPFERPLTLLFLISSTLCVGKIFLCSNIYFFFFLGSISLSNAWCEKYVHRFTWCFVVGCLKVSSTIPFKNFLSRIKFKMVVVVVRFGMKNIPCDW